MVRLSFGLTSLVHNALGQHVHAVVFIRGGLVALQPGSLDLACTGFTDNLCSLMGDLRVVLPLKTEICFSSEICYLQIDLGCYFWF